MGYIDRVNKQGLNVDLAGAPLTGGAFSRRQQVSTIRVDEGEAMSWRVVLQPLRFNESVPGTIVDASAGQPNKAAAIVTFGADGVMNEAIVDWPVRGGMFSVWGDQVQVVGAIPDEWQAGALPASVTFGGLVVPDGNPTARATRSVYGGTVAPGNVSALIEVPAFARSIRWHQVVHTGGFTGAVGMRIYGFMDAGGAFPTQISPENVLNTGELTWPTDQGLTLDPQTRYIQWRHTDGVNQIGIQLEFVLDLG